MCGLTWQCAADLGPDMKCSIPPPCPAFQLAAPKSCSLCVVVGGGARPPSIPKAARCVKEEWLLQVRLDSVCLFGLAPIMGMLRSEQQRRRACR